MTVSEIQKHLKKHGIYKFYLDYMDKKYNITVVMFTKDKKIILFEAIESIKEVVFNETTKLYDEIKIEINKSIITNNFLKEITKTTGCFRTKQQHRPARRIIEKWLNQNTEDKKNEKNDVIYYDNFELKTKKTHRENLFVSKNRFNLFFNNAYFYFENGFFKIIEDYFEIIEEQSIARKMEMDKMYLFIVYCLSDDCIKAYLKTLLESTYRWLDSHNLNLIDIYRLDYIEYEKNLSFIAKNFLFHTMKLEVEKMKPRPVSVNKDIIPLTKNLSFTIELNNEKFLFIPFSPREGVIIAFKSETILNEDVDFSLPIQGEQEILNQIVFSKDFLRDKQIVVPSNEKYLSFSKKYTENFVFDLNLDLEFFVMNEFESKIVKIDDFHFKVYEYSDFIELEHKKVFFSIILNKDNTINFKISNYNDLHTKFAFVNYLDGFNINNFWFFIRFKSKTYLFCFRGE